MRFHTNRHFLMNLKLEIDKIYTHKIQFDDHRFKEWLYWGKYTHFIQ